MLGVSELRQVVDGVTYRPGWKFSVLEHEYEGPLICIETRVPHRDNPDTDTVLRIKSPLPWFDTDKQFLHWLLWRLLRIESHECREFFLYCGQRVVDPHEDDLL